MIHPEQHEVYFDEVSIDPGDSCSAYDNDGVRYVFNVERRAWWVLPLLVMVEYLVPKSMRGSIANWGLNKGIELRLVNAFPPNGEEATT